MSLVRTLLLVVLIPQIILAQTATKVVSKNQDTDTFRDYLKFKDDLISIQDGEIFYYNENDLSLKERVALKNYPEDYTYYKLVELGDALYLICHPNLKNADIVQLYAYPVNIENNSLGAPKKIFETPNNRINARINGLSTVRFKAIPNLVQSADRSKICLIAANTAFVWGEDLIPIWQSTNIYGDFVDKGPFDIQSHYLDNNGDLYSLLKIYEFTKKITKKILIYGFDSYDYDDTRIKNRFQLSKYNAAGLEEKALSILENRYVHSLTLHRGPDQVLTCYGLTFPEKSKSSSIAILAFDLNNNQDIQEYPIEGDPNRTEKSRTKRPGSFHLHGLRLQNTTDNGIVLMTEQSFRFDPAGIRSSNSGIYGFGDILVYKIDLGGKLLWKKRIQKSQLINMRPSGYNYLYVNKKHYFVYLDHPKNTNPEAPENFIALGMKTVMNASVLDEQGTLSRTQLLDFPFHISAEASRYQRFLCDLGKGSFLFPMIDNDKSYSLIKLSL